MKVIKMLPILLGGTGVIQAVLNKTMAESIGLSMTSLFNAGIATLCAVFILVLSYYYPGYFPDIVTFNRANARTFQWWYLIPGIIGFCFVFFVPLVIMEVGALPVFLGVIAGQIVVSILWDAYYGNIPVSGIRVAGALMTLAGAFLVFWKK